MKTQDIRVKLRQYDGPLGLLLHLIQKEELSVQELDISVITEQYLSFLGQMKKLNFDIAGEYLYLAASLLYLKSKSCLEEDEDLKTLLEDEEMLPIKSRADLIKRLEELQLYQALGKKLWSLEKMGHEIFVKPKTNRKEIVDSVLTPLDLTELTGALIDHISREKRKIKIVQKERISIKSKLAELKSFLREGVIVKFFELLRRNNDDSLGNKIVTFISLLELARLKKIDIVQNSDKGDIFVNVTNKLDDFNVELADGFEPEVTVN